MRQVAGSGRAARLLRSMLAGATLVALAACNGAPGPVETASLPTELDILTRAEWGAHDPVLPMTRHRIDRITIHHTATLQNSSRTLTRKLVALQQFSQNPGKLASGKEKPAWADIPYHFYIDVSGQVGEGREAEYVGDTNTTYDPTGHLLIVLEGNFEEEQPTPAQMESLRRMIAWAAKRWSVPPERLAAHKDFAQTACPGANLYSRLPELREAMR